LEHLIFNQSSLNFQFIFNPFSFPFRFGGSQPKSELIFTHPRVQRIIFLFIFTNLREFENKIKFIRWSAAE